MAEPKTRPSKTRNRAQRRRRPVSALPPTTASRTRRRIDWREYAYPSGAFTVISDAVPHAEEEALLSA